MECEICKRKVSNNWGDYSSIRCQEHQDLTKHYLSTPPNKNSIVIKDTSMPKGCLIFLKAYIGIGFLLACLSLINSASASGVVLMFLFWPVLAIFHVVFGALII